MAVFSSTASVDGKPLNKLIGTPVLTNVAWDAIKEKVVQGGKTIMELRGRSSFQSPAYLSLEMIQAVMGGSGFDWPAGVYVSNKDFSNIMMAMETTLDKSGVHYHAVEGTPDEYKALQESYVHLCNLRDELIQSGVIPAIKEWNSINPNL